MTWRDRVAGALCGEAATGLRHSWLFGALLIVAGVLGSMGSAMASPGCVAINGKSGTLNKYGWAALVGSNTNFNAGDKATLTSSGGNSGSLLELVGSFALITNYGSGTVINSATWSGSGPDYPSVQNVFGPDSMSYSVACQSATPTLSGISPSSAGAGTTVRLTGAAFYGASAVRFGSADAAGLTVSNATSITVKVPSLMPGTYDVTVTTDAGTTGTVSFTVIATAPGAPAIGTATAGNTQASVAFTAPTSNGGATITGYTVTSSPGGITGTGNASPITVTGLSNGTAYTFTVTATNSVGTGAASAPSNAVTPQGGQTISFGAQAAQVFAAGGTFALNPAASSDSGLPVAYTSQTTGVCTISGEAVTMRAAGTCTIAADQAGDAAHTAAATVTQSIVIGQATQAISGFAANPVAPVFAPNGTFTVSANGGASGNPVLFAVAPASASVCSISGSTVTMRSTGMCSLTANQAGNANYSPAPQVVLDVAIAAAAPTLAWISGLQKIIGEPAFELPVPTSTSSGGFTYTSANPAVATVNGRTVSIVGAGTAVLVATQAAAGNYTAGSVSGTLTVSARPDPSRDVEVTGGLQAQVDASVRFVAAQQANIQGRLSQLRSSDGNPSSNGLALTLAGSSGTGLSLPANQVMSGDGTRLPAGWGVWTAGVITVGNQDARGSSGGMDFRSDGVTLGIDRRVGTHAVFGLAGSLGWHDTEFDGSTSQVDAEQRSLAMYGLWRGGEHWFVDGLAGLGRLDFDLARWSVAVDSTGTARREGEQRFAALTVGYAHTSQSLTLTGYGRGDTSRTTLDGYQENGLGIYDLRYGEQRVDNSGVALGIEGRHRIRGASRDFHPYWLFEYRQALEDSSTVGINYAVTPVANDYVLGLRSYHDDALLLGAGVDMELPHGWALSLLYRREQAADLDANSFGLRLSWGQGGGGPPQGVAGLSPAQPR